jgi:hypothetical protein
MSAVTPSCRHRAASNCQLCNKQLHNLFAADVNPLLTITSGIAIIEALVVQQSAAQNGGVGHKASLMTLRGETASR